jgi:SsrA-binding protein
MSRLPENMAANNRQARFEYEILEDVEAGIVLTGTEIKSIREGKANIKDSHAEPANYDGMGEAIWLVNAHIPEYEKSGKRNQHAPRRPRKLLLHKREFQKLAGKVRQKGLTLIALDIHFNKRGKAKIKLALCKGKAAHDKRQATKDREWKIEKARILKKSNA